MRHCLFVLFICVLPGSVWATPQEPDLLILEGQRIYTDDLPGLNEAFPDITFPKFLWISTANWGGYRATWATFQNQLYLVGLEGRVAGKKELSRNSDILPEHSFPIKVTAWSGKIVQEVKSSSYDIENKRLTDITETTTIIVNKGVVTNKTFSIKRLLRDSADEK